MLTRLNDRRVRAAGRIVGVAMLLFLLLGLGMASCSPELHRLICPEADQPNDFCAVKQFQNGLVEVPLLQAVGVSLLFVLVVTVCRGEELHLAFPLFRLSPSRAPPGFLLR
jgi:hypothetical protein